MKEETSKALVQLFSQSIKQTLAAAAVVLLLVLALYYCYWLALNSVDAP